MQRDRIDRESLLATGTWVLRLSIHDTAYTAVQLYLEVVDYELRRCLESLLRTRAAISIQNYLVQIEYL
eukprot:COSAG02_NODE_2448_length_8837_cov_38.266880_10_plen_69_part_00